MTPPDKNMQTPVKERRVLMHVAQSESAYATAIRGSWFLRKLRSRSDLLLLTLVLGLFVGPDVIWFSNSRCRHSVLYIGI